MPTLFYNIIIILVISYFFFIFFLMKSIVHYSKLVRVGHREFAIGFLNGLIFDCEQMKDSN